MFLSFNFSCHVFVQEFFFTFSSYSFTFILPSMKFCFSTFAVQDISEGYYAPPPPPPPPEKKGKKKKEKEKR